VLLWAVISDGKPVTKADLANTAYPPMIVGEFRIKHEYDSYSRPLATGLARFFHRSGSEALMGVLQNGHLRGEAAVFLADGTATLFGASVH
jgi:hypothetical protein